MAGLSAVAGPARVGHGGDTAERTSGLELVHAAGLSGLVHRASAQTTGEVGVGRSLPVLPELRDVLPGGGLRRGATVAVATTGAAAAGATSLLLALLAEASRSGSWCAVVGLPALNPTAAAEVGIALDRLALVPNPGPDWTGVVAALLDGLDIVAAAPPGPLAPTLTRRLTARARQRGSVLVSYGQWSGAEITLGAVRSRWHGLGEGRGRLQCRELTVVARGRAAAAAPRQARMWLPRPAGRYAELHPQLELDGAPVHTQEAGLAVVG